MGGETNIKPEYQNKTRVPGYQLLHQEQRSLLLMSQLVGLRPRFFFVPPLSSGFFSTGFFRPLPPPHWFSFVSPSHTTKKTERIRTFLADASYLVMSLCKRINHNQSLKIKSKLINLHNICFLPHHAHNFPSLFGRELFGSRDQEASYERSNRKYSFS